MHIALRFLMKLRFSAAIELDEISKRMRAAAVASLVCAGFVGISSVAGITIPATYARETSIWRVEGIGQDWANLAGYAFVPIALAFVALMGAALTGMAIALYAAHLTTSPALIVGAIILVAIAATALVWMLGATHAPPSERAVATFRMV